MMEGKGVFEIFMVTYILSLPYSKKLFSFPINLFAIILKDGLTKFILN